MECPFLICFYVTEIQDNSEIVQDEVRLPRVLCFSLSVISQKCCLFKEYPEMQNKLNNCLNYYSHVLYDHFQTEPLDGETFVQIWLIKVIQCY